VSLDHGCARDVLNNALEGSFKVACITGIYQYTTISKRYKLNQQTTLTSTNCSSYSVMINNPRGEIITETCRGNLEDPNEIKGAGSQGTILLKSDCTIRVGSKKNSAWKWEEAA
jgi:hypothetical protein